jgi:hypothetical protein
VVSEAIVVLMKFLRMRHVWCTQQLSYMLRMVDGSIGRHEQMARFVA